MKISKIEYENFRNFRDHGEIRCSTDGRITVIYGKNGDGKTTLHQLFQWVFYGQVHFNKTTTDRLYNLAYENELDYGTTFDVMGRIDFEHANVHYSCTRTYTYKKGLDDSEKIREDFTLSKMDDDHNWKRIDKPKDTIEMLLPSGLSEYFFFDGESMIADLRLKGKDSAGKLRKALYSIFDLDVLESAINHIGRTDLKTSVLGKLYLSKGSISSGSQINTVKANIENAQTRIQRFQDELTETEKKKADNQALITSISEQIGTLKSKADYEATRKSLKKQRDTFLRNAEMAQAEFGEVVVTTVPQLFISKAVRDAKARIHLKVETSKFPSGINKKLINYLLSDKTDVCICGNPLCDEEREHIRSFFNMLPPKNYASLYHDFIKTAQLWGEGYDQEHLENYIVHVLENNEQAAACDTQIRELDEAEKKAPDIENLIIARQEAEDAVEKLDDRISNLKTELKKLEIYLRKQMAEFDTLTSTSKANAQIENKISIMTAVLTHFRTKLEDESATFSRLLQDNIQDLINRMLTSKRSVYVSPEFSVRVIDSFNDESKSEGQFAVISFAYIGGIFKLLRSQEELSNKEYPLVLDGPFSKLDPDQRQNVIDTIPQFAPQVILFSKDDLDDIISPSMKGRVWTIVSNAEKNVAHVKEGHLWS